MCPVRIDWTEAEDRVLASSTLAGAGPHEQTWHLATALGWWASPGPRRRRNRGRVALVLGALPYCAFALADIFGAVELPKPAILFLGVAVAPASVHRRARTEPADRRCGTGRDDTRSLAVLRQRPSG